VSSTAKADDAPCPLQDALTETTTWSGEWRTSKNGWQKTTRDCSDALVYCVVPGAPKDAFKDTPPAELNPGETLTVVVLAPTVSKADYAIQLTTRTSRDVVFKSAAPARPASLAATGSGGPAPDSGRKCNEAALKKKLEESRDFFLFLDAEVPPIGAENDTWVQFAKAIKDSKRELEEKSSSKITVGEVDEVRVEVHKTPRGGPSADLYDRIPVNRGRYFVDAGIMVAAVHQGKRTYYETTDPSSGEHSIGLERDTKVSTVVMIEAFPFGGRRRSSVFFFDDPNRVLRWFNLVGIQAGTNLAAPTREWYFGGVIAPISGIGIGAGLALVPGQYLEEGTSRQAAAIAPGQSLQTRELTMARFYFSVSASLEILSSARTATSGF
jgi:hypothetical protein